MNSSALLRSVTAVALMVLLPATVAEGDNGSLPRGDQALYTPDRPLDFRHMHLEMTYTAAGIRARRAEGRVEYELEARGQAVTQVRLDAVDMRILEVELSLPDTENPAFAYDDEVLTVDLPRPFAPGEPFHLAVGFEVEDPELGLHFVLPSASSPGKPVMVYTQGEVSQTRYWVPTHGWPNERWTSEIAVTVPRPMSVVANGVLREKRPAGEDAVTFVWQNDVPTDPLHLGYVIGELVPLGGYKGGRDWVELPGTWRDKPLDIYTLPGLEAEARATFARVDSMLGFFEDTLGVEYPFPGYSYVVVMDHHHDGMELAGFSFLSPDAMTRGHTGEISPDPWEYAYIAHMVAHQWFGGLINYRALSEAWLNEGFASYLHILWLGHRDGEDAFAYELWQKGRVTARFDTSEEGRPMVNPHLDENEIFRFDGLKVYWKGAWVLHMLIQELGADLFWQGVHRYLEENRFQGVMTADLRRALEEISGRDLEQFFAQWVYGRGIPRLDAAYAWDTTHQRATVTLTQRLPPFVFPLELYFRVKGRDEYRRVDVGRKIQEFTFDFQAAPTQFAVDPRTRLLRTVEVHSPRTLRMEQARRGPTVIARIEAVLSLEAEARPEVVRALAEVVGDASQPWMVRAEAAEALGEMARTDARDALLAAARRRETASVPRLHAAVLRALGSYPGSEAAHEILLEPLPAPNHTAVEAAAVGALGGMRSSVRMVERSVERLRTAAAPSSRRLVHTAALRAMAKLADPRLWDTVFQLAQPGRDDHRREQAVRALAGVAGKDEELRERTRQALTAWLDDPDRGIQVVAAQALGILGNAEAVADLEHIAGSARRAVLRDAARQAVEAIRRSEAAESSALEARVEALEREIAELKESLSLP